MTDDRAVALTEIAHHVKTCTLCDLYKNTTQGVPGAGNIYADIMFIGEGPGEQEDKRGLPFVGRSGDYLNYLLKLIDLDRDSVFITNVVKHRPPGNRDPLPTEIAACKGYLDRQITLINPAIICTLGRFSMARYFPNAKITAIHGQPRIDEAEKRIYYPLFHPAAVLRNPELRRDMEADFHRLPGLIEEIKAMRAGRPLPSAAPPAPSPTAPANPVVPPVEPDPPEPPRQLRLF